MTTQESGRSSAPEDGDARDEGAADADSDASTGADADGDRPVARELPPSTTVEDLEADVPYLSEVNGVVEYGVFVDVTSDVSGLVHESTLDGATYEVGDRLVVELENVRPDGDVAFRPADPADPAAYRVGDGDGDPAAGDASPGTDGDDSAAGTDGDDSAAGGDDGPDRVRTATLSDRVGDRVVVEGEVVQVKQTSGPTVFQVRDEDGVVPCAAFESAGVRAYPGVDIDDPVRVEAVVERREGAVQLEVEELTELDGEAAAEVRDRVRAAVEERAEPPEIDPLVEWPALEAMYGDLRSVARTIRRAVLDGRPIRARYHADGDGMCAAVPLDLAVRRFVDTTHADPDAARHLFKRLPSKAPYYEMEDVTRDLNFALGDRDRHGQRLPLLVMLDNGSTAEDVPAYATLGHYDVPVVAVDHHHPDPEAVGDHLAAHVNPYLHGEDYRITTGMLSVELARLVAPGVTDEIRHVPAIAGVADRSDAEAMDQYFNLAAAEDHDREHLADVSEALDYAAYTLRYDAGRGLLEDLLAVACDDRDRHERVVELFAERSRAETDRQMAAVEAHVEGERLDNGARLYRIDVENHAHRFTFPAPGKTTGAVHDRKVEETGDPVITIGYGPDFAVLRSDGVRLDIPRMVSELEREIEGAGVSGGGHLVVGSIKFVPGRREEVLEALVGKMAEADIDESLGSADPAALSD